MHTGRHCPRTRCNPQVDPSRWQGDTSLARILYIMALVVRFSTRRRSLQLSMKHRAYICRRVCPEGRRKDGEEAQRLSARLNLTSLTDIVMKRNGGPRKWVFDVDTTFGCNQLRRFEEARRAEAYPYTKMTVRVLRRLDAQGRAKPNTCRRLAEYSNRILFPTR